MKTAIVALMLAFSVSLAANEPSQCQQYVTQAERYGAPPYPDYFGAGTEYFRAAECFARELQLETGKQYYALSADRFVTAAGELQSGGDFRLRGKSFEWAGDAYVRLDDKSKALDLYYQARGEYVTASLTSELAVVDAKIITLTGTNQQGSSTPWMIGLGILIVFFGLIVFLASRKRSTPIERDLLDESTGKRSTTIPALAEKVTSTTLSSLAGKGARERAAEKLRQKYAPKR